MPNPAEILETGFTIFSLPHIAVIAIIALLCVLCAIIYRKFSKSTQSKVALIFGICIAAIDISHYIVFYFKGTLTVFAIPLHLCYLAVYICLLFGIFRADWMGQVLYALCLPGAWCAILFPDWSRYPILAYESVDSFVIHGLVVIFIIMQLAAANIRPRLSAIWKPVIFLCVMAPVAAIANHFLGTNFMFISTASAGSPLEFLAVLSGSSHVLYLFFFALLVLLGMTIMYLPFFVYNIVKKTKL